MSRSRMTHNVNASLIHEARMILQQLLAGREIASWRPKASKSQPVMKCGLCTGGIIRDAIFVINGWSVCVVHEEKARGASNRPKFPGDPS
jgi:hypothetical protein